MSIETVGKRFTDALYYLKRNMIIRAEKDLLKGTDYTPATLTEIKKDRQKPNDYILGKLEEYRINIDWLILGEGKMLAPKDEDGLVEHSAPLVKGSLNNIQPIGKPENNSVHLIPREKKTYKIFVNGDINKPMFEALIPDKDDNKHYTPYFHTIENLINQYPDLSIFKKESMSNLWPITAQSDDVLRMDFNASFCFVYQHDNMRPSIDLGSKITAKFVDIDNWSPASYYCVFFKDRQMFIYTIAEGKDERHLKLISHDDGKYSSRNMAVDKILCIALVQEIARHK